MGLLMRRIRIAYRILVGKWLTSQQGPSYGTEIRIQQACSPIRASNSVGSLFT